MKRKPTVAIIDNSEDTLFILNNFLKTKYTIIQAQSGAEFFKILGKDHPRIDLLISDISMVGMDGIDLLNSFRNLNQYKDTTAIAITSHSSATFTVMLKASGFAAVLIKPVEFGAIAKTIADFIPESSLK